MKRLRQCVVLAFAACAAIGPATAEAPTITVAPAEQQKLGIETTTLAATTMKASAPAFIRVLDPSALSTLDADLAAAEAAAHASARERERLARLAAADDSVSRQAAEAAAAKAAADEAQAVALKRRLGVEWAPALAAMASKDSKMLLDDLVAGKAALIRADVLGANAFDASEIFVFAGGAPMIAPALGRAGAVDPRTRTLGVVAIVKGAGVELLAPGATFQGRVSGGGDMTGVVIPRGAVVRLDGADWAYVKTADAAFERREISDAVRTKDGWFVRAAFAPGDQLVVIGAGSLLGVERADESAEAD